MKIRMRGSDMPTVILAMKAHLSMLVLWVLFTCLLIPSGHAQDTLTQGTNLQQKSRTSRDTVLENVQGTDSVGPNSAGARQRDTVMAVPITETKTTTRSGDTLKRDTDEITEKNKLIMAGWQFWLGVITVLVTTLGTVGVALITNRRSTERGSESGKSSWPTSALLAIPILTLAIYTFIVIPSRAAPAEGAVDREMVLRLIHAEAADETQVQQWVYEATRRQSFQSDSSLISLRTSVRQFEVDLARHQKTLQDYTRQIDLLANSLRESQGRFPTEHYLLTTTSNVQKEIFQIRFELEQFERNIARSGGVNPNQTAGESRSLLVWQILTMLNAAIAAGFAALFLYRRTRRYPSAMEARSARYP